MYEWTFDNLTVDEASVRLLGNLLCTSCQEVHVQRTENSRVFPLQSFRGLLGGLAHGIFNNKNNTSMKENRNPGRKGYLEPCVWLVHLDGDSRLLAGSPGVGFDPGVVPPTDDDGGDDDEIEG